jgi:hypothetical protein
MVWSILVLRENVWLHVSKSPRQGQLKLSVDAETSPLVNYFPANTKIELITFPLQEQFCYINWQISLQREGTFQSKHRSRKVFNSGKVNWILGECGGKVIPGTWEIYALTFPQTILCQKSYSDQSIANFFYYLSQNCFLKTKRWKLIVQLFSFDAVTSFEKSDQYMSIKH